MNKDKFEELGIIIDEIENLASALELPVSSDIHVASLRNLLPEKVQRLKDFFIEITGENPWE